MRRPFKKLDDVVKAMDFFFFFWDAPNCFGCPYADENGEAACCGNDREDALHYLKVLQELIEFISSPVEVLNDPLEWTELKSMIGKPVWIEPNKEWGIVADVYKDMFGDERIAFSCSRVERMKLSEKYYGDGWQAFRKEL